MLAEDRDRDRDHTDRIAELEQQAAQIHPPREQLSLLPQARPLLPADQADPHHKRNLDQPQS